MKKILLLVLLSSTCLFAQEANHAKTNDLPTIIPPSPSVATLMRFEEVPVDEYSGVPDISLPIYAKQLGGNLNFNIGLKYSPSGVKLKQRSGWTGTGWTLISGGAISRTVAGKPDDKLITGVLHNNFFNWDTMTFAEKEQFTWEAVNGTLNGVLDSEIDLYQFNFLGNSGRFVIVKNGGNVEAKILSYDQKLKIDLVLDIDLQVDKFIITNQFGYIFEFDVIEVSTSDTISTTSSYNGQVSNTGIESAANSHSVFRSAWKLSKIKTSNGIELANLTYDSVVESFSNPGSSYSTRPVTPTSVSNLGQEGTRFHNQGLLEPKYSGSYTSMNITTKKLSEVTFPRDNSQVLFSNILGHPEYGNQQVGFSSCKLNAIQVKNDLNEIVEKFDFIYSTNTLGNRLFLDKMNHTRGSIVLPYSLFYQNKNSLPGFDDTRKDIWGYFNDEYNSHTVKIKGGSANLSEIKTGILTKIEFPTGGIKEFEFESNSFNYIGSTLVDKYTIPENFLLYGINGNFTHDITQPTAYNDLGFIYINAPTTKASLIINNITNHSADQGNLDKFFFKITPVVIKPGVGFDPNCTGTCTEPTDRNDFLSPNYSLSQEYKINTLVHNMTLSEGWYFVEFSGNDYFPNGAGYENGVLPGMVKADFSLNYDKFIFTQHYMNGGGLRIKNVKFTDNGMEKSSTKYKYTNFNNTLLSSGSLDYDFNTNKEYVITRKYPLAYDPNSLTVARSIGSINFIAKRTSDIQVQMTKGNYIGYKNIIKYQDNNGEIKSTYTSPIDYPAYPSNYSYPFLPYPDLDYKHGLLLTQKIYDNNGKILSEVSNIDANGIPNYTFISNEIVNNLSFANPIDSSCSWDLLYSTYESNKNITPNKNSYQGLGEANPQSCYPGENPINIETYSYYSSIARLNKTAKKDYFYDAQNNQTIVRTNEYFMYSDYNNQLSAQVKEVTENSNTTQIGEHYRTEYKYPNGYTSSAYSTEEQTAISRLDDVHNINEVVATSSHKDGVLLGVSQNAYKEFETNLILPSKSQVSKGSGIPIDRLIYHRYDTYGNPLEVSKKDGTKISYIWGYSQTKPIAKIEGASYTEIATALGITEVQLLAFNELNLTEINSLRTSLPKAMTSTYTYELLVGITSSTDARGYITTYIYDDFNRLKQVKDANGNILSESEYNYKNQN